MRTSILACIVLLAGCPRPEADGTEGRLELAAPAGDALLRMEDGHPLELVAGPQGGYHLDVGVRIFGTDPAGGTLSYEVWGAERRLSADLAYALRSGRYRPIDDHWEREGDRAILDIRDPAEVVGQAVELVGILELPDGTIAMDACTVRVIE